MNDSHMLRRPRKGETYDASNCVLRTVDALLSYKRGYMKGVDASEAKAWEDGLRDVIEGWNHTRNHLTERKIDNAVLELVKVVVDYTPIRADDDRGY